MTRPRKTRDEFDIEMKTSCGWEIADCQPTYSEALQSIRTYRKECPGYSYRIKHRRVRIAPPSQAG